MATAKPLASTWKSVWVAPGNKLSQGHLKSDFGRWDEMCYCWVLGCPASLRYPSVEVAILARPGANAQTPSAAFLLPTDSVSSSHVGTAEVKVKTQQLFKLMDCPCRWGWCRFSAQFSDHPQKKVKFEKKIFMRKCITALPLQPLHGLVLEATVDMSIYLKARAVITPTLTLGNAR